MADNVNIIVQDTINDIVVNAAVVVETIDINVQAAVDVVDIVANPNNYVVNINRIIGEQVQSDWNQSDNQAPDYIKNKPSIPTLTSDLTNDGEDGVNPFITAADVTPQVNSDWDATTGVAQILNKPTLATVATSGSYNDLINKPTIPAAQVNSDWNATSGVAEILNKPTIPAAVTKTSDLTNDGEDGINPFITAADIPPVTGFVPYTGATSNVDLGTHTLSAKDLVINHSSGSGVAASITKGGAGEALTINKTSGSGNAMSVTGGVTQLDELHLTTDLADSYIASAVTWNGKQAALVSGTNIKTINGSSVLGSGDLVVGGTNIYGSDGSLTAARTLTLNAFPLTFAGTTSTRFYANGNIGVNQLTDIASAQLSISSTTKGVLIPRMTLAQRNAISTPAAGLQVVVTGETFGEFLSFYNADRVIWERAVMSRSSVLSCVFVGQASGFNVTAVTNSNFIGSEAGSTATAANGSNFLGNTAGKNATNAANSNFLGTGAGLSATNAQQSNFLGLSAGEGATGALQSFFVGSYTGYQATGASGSVFLGNGAGISATNASNSNFIGRSTGTGATGANNSNFFGNNVGNSSRHAITGANNILIGTNITTPTAATANSANIGGVLYLNNTYGTTSGNPQATAQTNGKVGINTTTPVASAVLEIVSTTAGVLFPRMTTTQKNAIVTPTAGLVVYDTTLAKLCLYTTTWETITSL